MRRVFFCIFTFVFFLSSVYAGSDIKKKSSVNSICGIIQWHQTQVQVHWFYLVHIL